MPEPTHLFEKIAQLEARIAVLEGKLQHWHPVPPAPVVSPNTNFPVPQVPPVPYVWPQFVPAQPQWPTPQPWPYTITCKTENDK